MQNKKEQCEKMRKEPREKKWAMIKLSKAYTNRVQDYCRIYFLLY